MLGTVSKLSQGEAEPVLCPPARLVHKWTTGRRTGAASEQVCARRQRASRLAAVAPQHTSPRPAPGPPQPAECVGARSTKTALSQSLHGRTAQDAGEAEAARLLSACASSPGRQEGGWRSDHVSSSATSKELQPQAPQGGQCARVAQTAEPEEGPLPASAESAQPAQSASQHRGRT